MTEPIPFPAESPEPPRQFLPLLLLLFVGSGCAALIYEIVWFHLLQLVIGSSGISLGVLLGTFMGGMCLGSLLLPRYIPAEWHPLRVYAAIEVGIGVFGLLVLFGMPLVSGVYTAVVGHGLPGILLRAVVCVLCLLGPTLLMGATLPAIARWIETTPSGVSWLGFFYGSNIAGAVTGCLLAGFYLLRVYDTATATYVAVAINAVVAAIGFALASRTRHQPRTEAPAEAAAGSWPVYLTIALSGLCALGCEVIWTRLLGLMLGATVYTFSIILAVFLVGLGIGSSVGAMAARQSGNPRTALGVCQALQIGAIAWAAYMLAKSIPYWPINAALATSPYLTFQLDLARCAWTILPATVLWGASFPLALGAVAAPGQDPGKLVGRVYAANTVGAILGAVWFSMILIPWIGTQQCERLLIFLSALAALVALSPVFRAARTLIPGVAIVAATAFLAYHVAGISPGVVAYGRQLVTRVTEPDVIYMGEGMNGSIAISQTDGVRMFHVSGKVEASSQPQDMRLQRMLGHISALLHPEPRSVLIVGFGAGVTAGSFVLHPSVKRIVICEIESLIPPAADKYFGEANYHIVSDPRVQIVYDDARHFIQTTNEKFDVITSDPIHPWVKGIASLYSAEYFELCKRRLNPGGVVTQWVPLYESDVPTVKSEIATFTEVFPNTVVWGNDIEGEGYDSLVSAKVAPMKIDIDALEERMNRPDHARVAQSLHAVGIPTVIDLLSTYAGSGAGLKGWLKDAQINRDRNLRLQYLAGMALNLAKAGDIYGQILRYCTFPEDLFTGSPERRDMLRRAIIGVHQGQSPVN